MNDAVSQIVQFQKFLFILKMIRVKLKHANRQNKHIFPGFKALI